MNRNIWNWKRYNRNVWVEPNTNVYQVLKNEFFGVEEVLSISPFYVYNGSSWINITPKFFNGTNWI